MSTGSVLLVDDDAILAVTAEILREEGFSVVQASSCEAVLALLRAGADDIGLIVSDGFMAGRDDPYVCLDRLRAHTHAPMVIWTAQPAAFYADYRARGYAGFLAKPFDMADMVALVTSLLPS